MFRLAGLNRGKAALEFANPDEADKAVTHMNGGQLDGSILSVQVSSQTRWLDQQDVQAHHFGSDL